VTDLTHQNDEFARLDYSRALERRPAALVVSESGGRAPDARLVGTAMHLVIASLDLKQPVTARLIEETKGKLVAEGAMTAALAERIDTEAIRGFFSSDLGALVLDSGNHVRREWPFTVGLPAGEADAELEQQTGTDLATDELVVVQGIIDMLVETLAGLVVIDFKTDRVAEVELNERAEAYRRQLELYARAAEDILQQPIAAKWLYFLALRRAVQV
jgi:ATP-dependent helicase/nuclease subunit A